MGSTTKSDMVGSVPISSGDVCDVCGHRLVLDLGGVADPHSEERFDILRCTSCGLGRTFPIPENLGDYYREAYYGGRHSFTARYCASRRVRIVQRAARAVPGSLLDIGCGDGTFLLSAAQRGYRVVGTEVGAAAQLARSGGVQVRSSLDEVKDLSPFDVVTMWHTLEHFTSPRAVVETVASLLRDRGLFVVAVPNSQGLQANMFRDRWFHLDVPRHVHHFGFKSLSLLLERSGFEIERWYHQEFEYDLFGWLQSGLNVVSDTPNVLFQAMIGKLGKRVRFTPSLPMQYAMGSTLAPAAALATLAGTALHRGGTLVAVARRRSG
jgi:SAM-dependent methyltransferase